MIAVMPMPGRPRVTVVAAVTVMAVVLTVTGGVVIVVGLVRMMRRGHCWCRLRVGRRHRASGPRPRVALDNRVSHPMMRRLVRRGRCPAIPTAGRRTCPMRGTVVAMTLGDVASGAPVPGLLRACARPVVGTWCIAGALRDRHAAGWRQGSVTGPGRKHRATCGPREQRSPRRSASRSWWLRGSGRGRCSRYPAWPRRSSRSRLARGW